MSEASAYDAIVIGGGASGLIAAAYLARGGKRTLLLEARDGFGGVEAASVAADGFSIPLGAPTLAALDPLVTKQLKLTRHGLTFAVRDMPLVGLRGDGKHIVIQRDARATAANIAIHSRQDAEIWPRFRRELFGLARALRPFWSGASRHSLGPALQQALDRMMRQGAMAWLDSWFESEALKTTLAFDATTNGLSVLEPGSALTLVWNAAQEMCGLQGAVAQPRGGMAAVVAALISAAQKAGVELRSGMDVRALVQDGAKAAGVRLASGETISAQTVVSSLSRRKTLDLLDPLAGGIASAAVIALSSAFSGEARVTLLLKSPPAFGGVHVPRNGRFVLAERSENYVDAEMAARAGRLADDPPFAFVVPTSVDDSLVPPGQHILSILARPVPRDPQTPWPQLKAELATRIVSALGRHIADLPEQISRVEIFTPDDMKTQYGADPARPTVDHMLAPAQQNIETPIAGLLLCGADTEPVAAISGRAARLAAAMATGARN
jgi:phytoene dehydrogenase-like protein